MSFLEGKPREWNHTNLTGTVNQSKAIGAENTGTGHSTVHSEDFQSCQPLCILVPLMSQSHSPSRICHRSRRGHRLDQLASENINRGKKKKKKQCGAYQSPLYWIRKSKVPHVCKLLFRIVGVCVCVCACTRVHTLVRWPKCVCALSELARLGDGRMHTENVKELV